MDEKLGTICPVKYLGPKASNVQVLGNAESTTNVRYIEDDQIVRVVDDVRIPFTDQWSDADGFGLFREDGLLLTWWQMLPGPHDELFLGSGWGFRMQPSIDLAEAEQPAAAATG